MVAYVSISSNIGVLQTTVAELVTVKEQQRKFMQLVSTAAYSNGNCSSRLHDYAHGMVHWVCYSIPTRHKETLTAKVPSSVP